METDRPDVTESPITVDAGHFQVETDIVRWVKESSETTQTHTILANQVNLKIGIAGNTAIQVGYHTYGRQKEKDLESGTQIVTEGHGDLTLRIKQNLNGNNKGNFAMAVLPYIKFPISKYEDDSRFGRWSYCTHVLHASGRMEVGISGGSRQAER